DRRGCRREGGRRVRRADVRRRPAPAGVRPGSARAGDAHARRLGPGVIVTAIGLVVLLIGERRQSAPLRFVGQPLASARFLIPAACAHGSGVFATWILLGLVLGAAGDVALLWPRAFVIGLGAFLLGHVAYAVAVAAIVPAREWLSPLAIAPVAAAVLALVWL